MNRSIKFRAWCRDGKKMIYFDNKVVMNDIYQARAIFSLANKKSKLLMQYIGLKDKNGKEVYEGDIVTYRDKERFIVEYDIAKTQYRSFYYKKEDRDIYTERLISDRCEVIGNIYENKEIIEEAYIVEDNHYDKENNKCN